ncbi:hemolysin family protein [Afifella pfennigii]|uniref:hemolysin family protein n=1 Tax=Afifella pfennigii TaxID=209897 RepID=UPI000A009C7E|nr:hemolysin family protein [Afifella pfennigii]
MSDDSARSPAGLAEDYSTDTASESVAERLRQTVKTMLGLKSNGSARSEIEHVLAADEAAGEAFAPEERAMLRAILKLGDMRVEDVMLPRADIDAVDHDVPLATVLMAFKEAGHSRMPVYRDTLDDPIGMVHLKDVVGWVLEQARKDVAHPSAEGASEDETERRFKFSAKLDFSPVDLSRPLSTTGIIRPILFVPPSMPARMLLERMQAGRTQMALVIDEYGGTDGLISLEDLVEIIVGEIEDEHDDEDEADITKIAEGVYVADARAELDDLSEAIGPGFLLGELGEEVETVGGLIYTLLGRIPVRGEIVHALEGYEIEVLEADPRRIKRVRIRERRKGRLAQRVKSRQADAVASVGAAQPGEPLPAAPLAAPDLAPLAGSASLEAGAPGARQTGTGEEASEKGESDKTQARPQGG